MSQKVNLEFISIECCNCQIHHAVFGIIYGNGFNSVLVIF